MNENTYLGMEQQKPKFGGKGKEKTPKGTGVEADSSPPSNPDLGATRGASSAISRMERTLFIVDLSKLEAEGDTLVGALVVYQPQHELKKVGNINHSHLEIKIVLTVIQQ